MCSDDKVIRRLPSSGISMINAGDAGMRASRSSARREWHHFSG
jgi:hypothetical protein